MKIYYLSDIHHESHLQTVLYDEVMKLNLDHDNDVLVIAGDIDMSGRTLRHVESVSPLFKAVVYVGGNHDFWGSEITNTDDFNSTVDNVHFLNNSSVIIGDVAFYGTTGWYHVDKKDEFEWKQKQSDPRNIRGTGYTELGSEMINEGHAKALTFAETTPLHQARKHVLVTHHPFTQQSVDPQYKDSPTSNWYATDNEQCLERFDCYIHGHIHYKWDYAINGKPVLCNPYGYPMEKTTLDFKIQSIEI